MSELRVFLAFAVLLVLSLFYTERGIKSALAPLCAVASVGLFVVFSGLLNMLAIGTAMVYAFGALALLYMLFRFVVQKRPLPSLGFGFWAFTIGSFVMLLVLLIREPMFFTWDEFSTWGTTAKLMKLNNAMYTTAQVGWLWTATQPPFLACIGYFVQFFGPEFVEWQQYAAINFLQMAAVAALLSPLEKKHWPLAAPLALIGFITPYLFTLYTQAVKITAPWLDSLADVPMGFLFGATLAAWFGASECGQIRRLVPSLLSLAALTFIKDTALALGLVAAVLMAVDVLFQKRKEGTRVVMHIAKAGCVLLTGIAAVVGPFLLWAQHLAQAADINRFELGGVRNAGMSELFILFFTDLFSGQQSEHFQLIVGEMPQMFLSTSSTMLTSGAMVVVFILALLAVAMWLTKEHAQRRRCLVFGLFSSLGFLPYFLLIMLTYLYVFRPEQAFESFERYMYPYYIGWFLAAVALFAVSAAQSQKENLSRLLTLGLCFLLTLRVWMFVPPAMSVVAFDSSEYEERRRFEDDVRALTAQLDPNGKTFIISTNDTGIRWFMYCYSFLPWQVDYSYGGGAFEEQELQEDGTRLITPIDADAWREHLIENDVTTVFIDEADDAFAQAYGEVFSDEMHGYFAGETQVYHVTHNENTVVLEPAGILP